jgi:hypothetical protein
LSTIKIFIFIAFNFSLATNEQTHPFIESGLLLISPKFVTLCSWYTNYEMRFCHWSYMAAGYPCVCIMLDHAHCTRCSVQMRLLSVMVLVLRLQ